MTVHGMERGIEHSQTKHQAQRRLYGQADQATQLVPGPVVVQAVKLEEVPLFGRQEWKTQEEARVNEVFAEQIGKVQERVNKAAQQAQANASAQEQVKTLRKQLVTSERLKQAHFAQLAKTELEATRMAVALVQGDLPVLQLAEQQGKKAIEEVKTSLTNHLEQVLRGKVTSSADFEQQLRAGGYRSQRSDEGAELVHERTGARFPVQEIQPNGERIGVQLTAAIERSQQREKEQTQTRNRGPKLK